MRFWGSKMFWGYLRKQWVLERERPKRLQTLGKQRSSGGGFLCGLNVPHPYAKGWDSFGLGNLIYVLEYICLHSGCFEYTQNTPSLSFKIVCNVHLGCQGFLSLVKSSPGILMFHFFSEK